MARYEIPLSPKAQTFSIALAGKTYQLTLIWRELSGWILDIADETQTPLIRGLPLVTGADLLAQFEHMGFGGQIIVETTGDPDAEPTYENLGENGKVYFVTD